MSNCIPYVVTDSIDFASAGHFSSRLCKKWVAVKRPSHNVEVESHPFYFAPSSDEGLKFTTGSESAGDGPFVLLRSKAGHSTQEVKDEAKIRGYLPCTVKKVLQCLGGEFFLSPIRVL